MKKIVLLIALVFSVITLSACQDTKYNDDSISVIFFTANSGSTLVESYFNLDPNQLIDEPEAPVRNGFIFNGWYKDFKKTELWDFDVDRVGDVSIILFAGWTPGLYQITYDTNGGELPNTSYPTEFYSGDSKVLPQPTRTGYTFVSWYLYDWEDESSTKPGDAGYTTIPANYFEDLILHAHWKSISVRVTFRANYPIDNQGPENPSARTVDFGSVIDFDVLDDTATYRFLGWNSKEDGTGIFYTNGELFERTQRITLYGKWELIE